MKKREVFILDTIWAQLVKAKAGWKCEHCKVVGTRMEAAHVVGRRHRATRWGCHLGGAVDYDLCGHCLCHNCHQQYDEHGPREEAIVIGTIGVLRKAFIQREAIKLVANEQEFKTIKDFLEGLYDKYNVKREKPEGLVGTKAQRSFC